MTTYDDIALQLLEKKAGQISERNKAYDEIARMNKILEDLDSELSPFKSDLADLESVRQNLIGPWIGERRDKTRDWFIPNAPCRIGYRVAWARAMFPGTRWIWTANIYAFERHSHGFKQIQTTDSSNEEGWAALLIEADEELVRRGYVLLNTPEEVAEATLRYWPSPSVAEAMKGWSA